MKRDISPADEAARLARLRDERGFRAFKVRLGVPTGHDRDASPGRTEALIPAVRQAVGDDVELLADGNSCYTPPKAIEVGRRMEDNGYFWFEEPCPYWELEWTAEVAAALAMHVAGGEQDNDLAQWRRMIRMNAVDILQPDLCYIGGFTRAWRVAAMGAAASKRVVPHSSHLSLVTLFSLHFMAAIPNAGPFVEFTIEGDVNQRRVDLQPGAASPGRQSQDSRRSRLGRHAQFGVAGESRLPEERTLVTSTTRSSVNAGRSSIPRSSCPRAVYCRVSRTSPSGRRQTTSY